jgi:hypothetical protein
MKGLIKLPLKAFWRLTGTVRRPVVRKVENLLRRCCTVEHHHHPVACHVTDETSLLMDHMIRELVRLQAKVDRLQDAVAELSPAVEPLSVVSDDDAEGVPSRTAG